MNNENAHHRIIEIFDTDHVDYALVTHAPCRTSEESALARGGAGYPQAIGAKALVVKFEFADRTINATLVVPAHLRLDGKSVRNHVAGLKRFRFLTTEEMISAVQLTPGCMPPFGNIVFPRVEALYIDPKLQEVETIGFNAAHAERSIVVSTADYLRAAAPTALVCLTADMPQQVPQQAGLPIVGGVGCNLAT